MLFARCKDSDPALGVYWDKRGSQLSGGFTLAEWFVLIEHELLLFAGIFFLLGTIDELAVDLVWLWLKSTGRATTVRGQIAPNQPLDGQAAIFVPAWREAEVIGATIRHALSVWIQPDLRIYAGCYRNDRATAEAVIAVANGDTRLRLVIHDRDGPSTKADCLNRLYRALCVDEGRAGATARMVVLHDAEDMVDRHALTVLDTAIGDADLVQLPVLPVPVRGARWISGHYCEEFAEAHTKGMVVRDALRAGLPSAGVGCAIARSMLGKLADLRGADGPFAAECLTEDYELGLGVAALGGRQRFLRRRAADGRLVATRACFPGRLDDAVRQKTRWIHGIASQGWDRLGWSRRPSELWMRLRDRRGPLTALVLAVAYLLVLLTALGVALAWAGLAPPLRLTPLLETLLWINLAGFAWRAVWRCAFTTREYGLAEGLFAVLRIPLANFIAILAGRRALWAYVRSLAGAAPRWDKTHHHAHPALFDPRGAAA